MQSGARSLLVLGFTILDDLINYNEPDVPKPRIRGR